MTTPLGLLLLALRLFARGLWDDALVAIGLKWRPSTGPARWRRGS